MNPRGKSNTDSNATTEQDEAKLAEELAARQAELDADGAEPAAEEAAVPSTPAPVPPTAPAPTIGTEQPVAVERRPGAGPVPAGQVGRIARPLGKRGARQAAREERLRG